MLVKLVKGTTIENNTSIDPIVDINICGEVDPKHVALLMKVELKKYFYKKLNDKVAGDKQKFTNIFSIVNRVIDSINYEYLSNAILLAVQDLYFQLISNGIFINTTEVYDLLKAKRESIEVRPKS